MLKYLTSQSTFYKDLAVLQLCVLYLFQTVFLTALKLKRKRLKKLFPSMYNENHKVIEILIF